MAWQAYGAVPYAATYIILTPSHIRARPTTRQGGVGSATDLPERCRDQRDLEARIIEQLAVAVPVRRLPARSDLNLGAPDPLHMAEVKLRGLFECPPHTASQK